MARGQRRAFSILRAIWRGQIRALQILLTPVVLVLMLGCVVHLAVNSALARVQVEGFLDELFAGQVSLTQLRLGLDPRNLDIYGVRLFDPEGEEAVSLEALHVELDLAALVDGRVHLTRVHAPSAKTWLVWDRRGNFNYTRLFYAGPAREEDPEEPPSAFRMDIEEVSVGRIEGGLRFPDFVIEIPDARVEGFALHLAGGEMTMKAREIAIEEGELRFDPEMFGFQRSVEGVEDPAARGVLRVPMRGTRAEGWDWFGEGFRVARLHTEAQGAVLDLTDGLMQFRGSGGFDYGGLLRVQVPASYPPLEYFTGPLLESPFDLTMGVEGFLGADMNLGSHIGAGVDVELSQIKLKGMTFDRGLLGAQLVNRRLYLTSLTLEGYEGAVRLPEGASGPLPAEVFAASAPPVAPGRAWLSLLDISYRMPLVVEGLALGRLLRDAAPALEESAVVPATGLLDARLLAEGRLSDAREGERLEVLPAYHRVWLEEVVLSRPPEVVARAEAVVPTRRLRARGQVLWREGVLRGEAPLVLELDNDQVEVSGVEVDLNEDSTPVKARVEGRFGEVGAYLSRYGLEGFGGEAQVSFEVEGPALDPTVRGGWLRLERPLIAGYPGERAEVRFGLLGGWLRLEEVSLRGSFGVLEARGRVGLYQGSLASISTNPALELSFSAAPVDLGAVQRLLGLEVGLAGQLFVEGGEVVGRARRPEIKARVRGGALLVDSQPIKALEAELEVGLERIKAPRVAVDLGAEGRVRAAVDWAFGGEIKADLTVHGLRLEEIEAARPAGLVGVVEALDFHVEGSLDVEALGASGAPAQPGGAATRSGGDVLRWLTTSPLSLRGALSLERLRLNGMRLGGVAGAWSTTPEAHLLTLAPLPYLDRASQAYLTGSPVEGQWQVRDLRPALLSVDLSVPRAADDPWIEARLRFSDLNGKSLLETWLHQLTAVADGEALGAATGRGAKAAASEINSPPEGGRLEGVRAAIRRASVARPANSLAAQREELLGVLGDLVVSGEADLYLNRDDLSYQAEVELERLQLTALGRTLRNAEPIAVSVNNGDLVTVESLTLGTQERFVRLQGAVTLGKGSAEPLLNLKLSGALDLALLNLMPTVYTDLRGIAAVDLSVDGLLSQLRPSGTVRFSSGSDQVSLRLRGLDQEVVLERGVIALCGPAASAGRGELGRLCAGQPDAVVIPAREPLELAGFDGRASLWGKMGLKDFKPGAIEAFLDARNMTFTVPGVMFVSFHVPSLSLTIGDLSDYDTWQLTGQLDIFDGRYFQELNIVQGVLSGLTDRRASQAEIPLLERVPLLRQMGYDLVINGRDGFKVKSSIDTVTLDLELKTNLEIKKARGVALRQDLEALQVEGTLEILAGGIITYQGGDFQVRKGDLTWSPRESVVNPRLDLIAETEVQSACGQLQSRAEGTNSDDLGAASSQQTYDITMNVQGFLQSPVVSFDSIPFANQVDVLLLILTGCTADQITASAAGSPALELALRPFLSRVEREIGQYFEVDDLRLEGSLDQIVVRVDKRFSNRFVLRLSGAFGTDEAEQSLGARYFLYDNVFFDISERTEEQSGAVKLDGDLRLRLNLPE
jgi:hypothetical protein